MTCSAVRSNRGLDANAHYLTRTHRVDCSESPRNDRTEMLHSVGACSQDHDTDRVLRDVLLMLEVLISRQKNIELRSGKTEEGTVLCATPAHLLDRPYVVVAELSRQMTRKRFVKQYAHSRSTPRGLARARRSLVHGSRWERHRGTLRGCRPPRGSR